MKPFPHLNDRIMIMKSIKYVVVAWFLMVTTYASSQATKEVRLERGKLQLDWVRSQNGYKLKDIFLNNAEGRLPLSDPSGMYSVLYSASKPSFCDSVDRYADKRLANFPEPKYRYILPLWKEATSPVALNTAGSYMKFFPKTCVRAKDGSLHFGYENDFFAVTAIWKFDDDYAGDIQVKMTLKAKKKGYFSLASPGLVAGSRSTFKWAAVPGVLQGRSINRDFIQAYGYANGIPDLPVVVRERTASTLSSFLTTAEGVTYATTAAPGTAADPWEKDKSTRNKWKLGLSVMNREGQMSPTLYHPVLGEEGSYLNAGDSTEFSFRYTIARENWYQTFKHVVNDVYQFKENLLLKQTKLSLTRRLYEMYDYVTSDSTSLWKTYLFKGKEIGAQQYLGGVYGSNKDAIKNADYGAMWMLAKLTGDSLLKFNRLPYAVNFKLTQQHTAPDFLYGSAAGQYYLSKSKRFTEEWGPYSEPIGTAYYLIMDIGNILLFNPANQALRLELRRAADWLLKTMHADGHWEVAYDNKTFRPLFTDLKDRRPTFYGMLVAYSIFKDKKYLEAAIKGADWFVENAVQKSAFLGVCGDARFAPDFATIQSVQALLSLYDMTRDMKYKKAAIQTARLYTTSVYTHPIATQKQKTVHGASRADFEISQVGLGFEHGGILGSANTRGPILLASHAGLFVRLYRQTGDSLFLNMARAAVWGRDAFIDQKTGVASYYWSAMDNGPGPYPHHAWWQIGWITDYLVSESLLRSEGKIAFEGSFMTPKVGPHRSYGFAPGKVYKTSVNLLMEKGLVNTHNPYIDDLTAWQTDHKALYVILLNNSIRKQKTSVDIKLHKGKIKAILLLDHEGKVEKSFNGAGRIDNTMAIHVPVTMKSADLKTIKIQLK